MVTLFELAPHRTKPDRASRAIGRSSSNNAEYLGSFAWLPTLVLCEPEVCPENATWYNGNYGNSWKALLQQSTSSTELT